MKILDTEKSPKVGMHRPVTQVLWKDHMPPRHREQEEASQSASQVISAPDNTTANRANFAV